jgi:hypothetical protein
LNYSFFVSNVAHHNSGIYLTPRAAIAELIIIARSASQFAAKRNLIGDQLPGFFGGIVELQGDRKKLELI